MASEALQTAGQPGKTQEAELQRRQKLEHLCDTYLEPVGLDTNTLNEIMDEIQHPDSLFPDTLLPKVKECVADVLFLLEQDGVPPEQLLDVPFRKLLNQSGKTQAAPSPLPTAEVQPNPALPHSSADIQLATATQPQTLRDILRPPKLPPSPGTQSQSHTESEKKEDTLSPLPNLALDLPTSQPTPQAASIDLPPREDSETQSHFSVAFTKLCESAQQTLSVFTTFKRQFLVDLRPFGDDLAHRFLAEMLWKTTLIELHNVVSIGMRSFWPERETRILACLSVAKEKPDLEATLKQKLHSLVGKHRELLFQGKFPLTAAVQALRTLARQPAWDAFVPSLLDLGVLLLFFGKQGMAHSSPGAPALGIDFGSEHIPLSFRILKVHRLTPLVANYAAPYHAAQLAEFEKEIQLLLKQLGKAKEFTP